MFNITDYYNILVGDDYPYFIDKYLVTKALRRLTDISQFYGCDYSKMHSVKYWYTKLDHSMACALITWHFTHDKKATLTALFHEIETPVFSFSVKQMLDMENNKSVEQTKLILQSSPEIVDYLTTDGLTVEDVCDSDDYPLIASCKLELNICQLENIFHFLFAWQGIWTLFNIKEVYDCLEVVKNENDIKELIIKNSEMAEKLVLGANIRSQYFTSAEFIYTIKYIEDELNHLLTSTIIDFNELYLLSEDDITLLISKHTQSWLVFQNTLTVEIDSKKPTGYYVKLDKTPDYINPLVMNNNKIKPWSKLSKIHKKLLKKTNKDIAPKYAYIPNIKSV